MKTKELRRLLREAFEAGRDYQYNINPYNNKPIGDALSFTKWYNKLKNLDPEFNDIVNKEFWNLLENDSKP